jgi:hypothetical protein
MGKINHAKRIVPGPDGVVAPGQALLLKNGANRRKKFENACLSLWTVHI